jgi:GNAT superfamily N-acetyltransferase
MNKPLHGRLSAWRSRGCRKHGGASTDRATLRAAAADEPGDTIATAMQLAIGLLTASLDSPQLEAWAAAALTPLDADGLGNFMAGLHVVSELLLHELHEATGEPPEATLQRLAILAEHRRRGLPGQLFLATAGSAARLHRGQSCGRVVQSARSGPSSRRWLRTVRIVPTCRPPGSGVGTEP